MIPFYIPLARSRAAQFREEVDLFVRHLVAKKTQDWRSSGLWQDLWLIVHPISNSLSHYGAYREVDMPLVVDKSIVWVSELSNKITINDIINAREILEEGLDHWTSAYTVLQKVISQRQYDLSEVHWLLEVVPLAIHRGIQARRLLETAWPVASQDVEETTRKEMRQNKSVDLDEAFARISGRSKEEWRSVVEEELKKRDGGE